MLDLIIRDALVIDGTGAPARRADVGVANGRITAIASPGTLADDAEREVDAHGLALSPGFIDLHTHYDAQVLWDRTLKPSPLHGVTTVIGGNCGYSLGPVKPEDRSWLLALLARVEGVPMAALDEGVDVTWETFGGYLDAIEGPLGVNMGFYVGHSPLRRAVMGPAATTDAATPEQVAEMCELLDQSLAAGGMGFATAIQKAHIDGDGRPTPPQAADYDEIRALAEVCGRHPGTWMQMTPTQAPPTEEQQRLLADMSIASNRPVSWLLVRQPGDTDVAVMAEQEGGRLWGQLFLTAGVPLRQSFGDGLIMRNLPQPWSQVLDLPHPQRIEALRDPDVRAGLRAALEEDRAVDFRHEGAERWERFEVNDCGEPSMAHFVGRKLTDIGAELGLDAFDTALQLAADAKLDIGFSAPGLGGNDDRATQAKLLKEPHVVIGASDAGAHIDSFVGADYGTRLLAELVRKDSLLTLEEAIHCLTEVPATSFGLVDRGVLRDGAWADMVLFDPATIAPTRMHPLTDWPGGAWHLTTEAVGIHRVFVAGREVVIDGEYTGDLPGKVLRSGRDTVTVAPH